MNDMLRVADVSELTGIPVSTLRWMRHQGSGPLSWKLGRATVYDRADVEAWIAKQKAATSVGG